MLICLREGFFQLNLSFQPSYLLQQESCEDDNDFNINTIFFLTWSKPHYLGNQSLVQCQIPAKKGKKSCKVLMCKDFSQNPEYVNRFSLRNGCDAMELKCKLVQMEWWRVNFRLHISTSHVSYFICQIQHNSEASFKPLTSLHLLNITLDALQIWVQRKPK